MNFSGTAFQKAAWRVALRRPHELNARNRRRFFLLARAAGKSAEAMNAQMPISATSCAYGQPAMPAASLHWHGCAVA